MSGPFERASSMSDSASSSSAACLSLPLHRSATTSRVIQAPTPPRAFGANVYMMKDEHERERTRWQAKIDEIAQKLNDSENLHSEMTNKKIVELEKGSKPLTEQNRKLVERNKSLQNEVKKCEKELCEVKDELLTLKDTHERIAKENSVLREKRVFPQEKMEELDQLRTQILEYSKCINALRQSGQEKDRRYDLLVDKFRRVKKCLQKSSAEETEAETRSSLQSATSEESLDPVLIDFEECLREDIEASLRLLARENDELQRTLGRLSEETADCEMIRTQLSRAHTTIAQQQMHLDAQREKIDVLDELQNRLIAQNEKIAGLEQTIESLKSEEDNELLEFQIVEKDGEMEELQKAMQNFSLPEFPCMNNPQTSQEPKNYSVIESAEFKHNLNELRDSTALSMSQRQAIARALAHVSALESTLQTSAAQTRDWAEREENYMDKIERMQEELQASAQKMQKTIALEIQLSEMKQTTLELERAKQTHNNELEKVKLILQQREEQLNKLRSSNGQGTEMEKLKAEIQRLEAEVQKYKDEARPAIRTELERRYEETKYRLACAMEKIHEYEMFIEAAKKHEDRPLVDGLQEELIELKTYNAHLERQFQAQTDIIEALKTRVIKHRTLTDLLHKSTETPSFDLDAHLAEFQKQHKAEKDIAKLAEAIRIIVLRCSGQATLATGLLTHSKVRFSHSSDSSGLSSSQSTGSDGRHSDEE